MPPTRINIPGYFNWGYDRKVLEYRNRKWNVPGRAPIDRCYEEIDKYLADEAIEQLISFVLLGMVVVINATVKTVKNKVNEYRFRRPKRQHIRVGSFHMNLGK